MRYKVLLFGAVALLALIGSAWAADVTGKWVAEIQGFQGTTQTTFTFKVEGTALTGTITNQRGETAISEGKIDGDDISFVTVRKVGQNQDMEMKTTYKGKVSGDEIKFTMERQMPPGGFGGMGGPGGGPGAGAAPAGGPGGGPGGGMGGPRPPTEFVAKRAK